MPEPDLPEDRQREEHAGEAGEVDQCEHRAGGERAVADQVRRDQRVAAAPFQPDQPPGQRDQQQHRQRQAPVRPGRPAEPLPLDERHQQRDQRGRQQHDADQGRPAAGPGGWRPCGSSAAASGTATSPIGTLTRNTQRQPCSTPAAWMSSPPTSGPSAVDSPMTAPSAPNARPRAGPAYSSWMRAAMAGKNTPAPSPCTTRPATSWPGVCASPHARLASVNRVRPADVHAVVADPVADPAGRDQGQPEREHVAGDHPLQLARPGGEAALHARQRDVDDRRVEQRHERAHQQQHQAATGGGADTRPRRRGDLLAAAH